MLHRHLMISDDGRVAKAILLERKKYEINDCLMSEMKSDAEELNVNLDALHEMKTKKSEMKKLLKMRIGGLMRSEAEKKIATMKKLRFLKGSEFGEKEYMKHCRDNHTLQKYDVFMVFKSETALTIIFISYLFFCFTHSFFFWNPDYFLLLSLTIISAFYYNDLNEEDLHHRFYLFYCTNTLFVHVW